MATRVAGNEPGRSSVASLMPERRRFPPPWTIEERPACTPAAKSWLFVYFEEESGRRTAAKLMTRDEARRIAANIAKLPNMLHRQP